jgi:hypothetical protein
MWRYDHVDHYEVSDDLGDHDYEHYGVSAPDDDLGDHDPFPHYDLGDHDPFPHHHDLPAHDLPALNRWVPARGTLSMRFRPTIHTRAGAHYPDGSYGAGCLDPPSVEQWSVSTRNSVTQRTPNDSRGFRSVDRSNAHGSRAYRQGSP